MKVVGLCILLLVATAVEAAQQRPYYGSTVSAVRLPDPVEGSDLDRITIHIGDIITTENVRQSIEALYATRHYQSIDVEAATEDGRVTLTFRAQPFFFLSGVQLAPAKLLDRSLISFIRVPLGARYSQAVVDRLAQATRELLESQGYFNAVLRPVPTFDKNTRLVTVTLNAEVQPQATVSSVELEGGGNTFSNKELLEALDIKPGEKYTLDKLEQGIGRIRQMFSKLGFLNTQVEVASPYDPATNTLKIRGHIERGKFAYVSLREPGGDPIDDVSREELRPLMPIFEEGSVDIDLIEEGEARLIRFMRQRGYFDVAVTWERVDAPLDDAVQITYIVDKGELRRLGTITFQGARHFTEAQLREAIRVRSSEGKKAGEFSRDQLESDVSTIRTMYENDGFFGVSVKATQQEDNAKKTIGLTIEIEEGPRHTITQVILSGATSIPETELRDAVKTLEGKPYSAAQIKAAGNSLRTIYHSRGYADARIVPQRTSSGPEGVDITFKINEGDLYKIGDILVTGNTLTAKKIVRRESLLQSGKPYFDEVILAEQHRLYATGLFNRVQIIPLDEERGPTRNLIIYVEDSSPILLSYGLGYQDSLGPRGTLEISHNNLWGLNRTLTTRLRLGRKEQSFQASYSEPYLFNHKIGGFASLFIEKSQRRYFTASTVDFSIQAVRGLTPHSNLILTASYQTVNLQDPVVNPAASQFPNATGIIQIARISGTLVQDNRDDAVDPHRGMFRTTTFQVASTALGGEVNFTSLYNQSIFYKPVGAQVLAISSRLGWKQPFSGDTAVPISERYFAGGSTTLRGFALDELRAGGGQLLAIGNVEYRATFFRFQSGGLGGVLLKSIGGALFYDTGNVFTRPSDFSLRDFTQTVGTGIRAMTPLGPIRLDFGLNLLPKVRITSTGDPQRDRRFRIFLTLGNSF
jgi:outer membrane protein assembly complex protein YaeT